MLLDFETPIGANFLKDWPAQNEINCDAIDEYAGPCLTTSPLLDYVPVLTAATTNPSLGTGGSLVGKYYTVFDQVYTWGEFRFGSGASVGSGIYRISLPFPAKTLLGVNNPFDSPVPCGNGVVFSSAADANRQPVLTNLGSADFLVFTIRMGLAVASRGVSHNIPFAWSGAPAPGGDGIQWSARYQREA